MSISVNKVSKLYGKQLALNGVSFTINKGEVVGFLGPNGAGKSTMMKIITCYLPPTLGSVQVCGFDIMNDSIEAKKQIGYLPEHNPLYLDMYVREYLSFVGGIYKISDTKRRVDQMIEMVGLGQEAHKKIEALSKGYRQRVGLAQAMIHDPQVLILDEPTSGLDPNQLEDIRKLIIQIGKEKTVMLSTHIMQEVEAICNRTIIINKGNIVADSTTEKLRQGKLSSGYELFVEFSGAVSKSVLKQIEGIVEITTVADNTYTIYTSDERDVRKEIAELAQKEGHSILTMTRKEQRLEDVFKQLTQ
jgi:ABC-2 type transport system ATP-binding protein